MGSWDKMLKDNTSNKINDNKSNKYSNHIIIK